MENQEKTEVEVKERKGWMGPETKTALMTIGALLLSITLAFLVAYSNQFSDSNSILGIIWGVIWGGIWGGIFGGSLGVIVGGSLGGILGGIAGGIAGGIWGGIVGIIVGCIVGGILGGILGVGVEKLKQKISMTTIVLLCINLFLPFSIMILPLSKYHNYRQLERDQKIVAILQITVLEDGVEVLLPDNYVGENSYLEKVFSLGWKGMAATENKKSWSKIAVPCRVGNKYWFYAKLPFPEGKNEVARLELFFDHAWWDHTATKEVSLKQ